ncbi:MAG: DUF4296 domain-containing protein [Balneola sp.]
MREFLFVSVFLFSFFGCVDEEIVPKPDNLIDEETYVKLMVEIQLLDAWIFTSDKISNPDSIKQELFRYYNTTEESFYLSNAYYQSNPEDHVARIDSALKLLEREQQLNQSSREALSLD